MQINILLVESHEIVRNGIRALLDGIPDMKICGEIHNAVDGNKQIVELMPDIILMEINLPVENGISSIKQIRNRHPKIKILVLSLQEFELHIIELMGAKADGYILKNTSKEELIFAIRKIANNGIYYCSEYTLALFSKLSNNHNHSNNHSKVALSDREKDVLLLIADGHTNSAIAEKLFTSIRTIETRRKRLLEKTGTSNTATLIRYAVKNGMVE